MSSEPPHSGSLGEVTDLLITPVCLDRLEGVGEAHPMPRRVAIPIVFSWEVGLADDNLGLSSTNGHNTRIIRQGC